MARGGFPAGLGLGLLLGIGSAWALRPQPPPALPRAPALAPAPDPTPASTDAGSPRAAEARLRRLATQARVEQQWPEALENLATWSADDPVAVLEFLRTAPRFPHRTFAYGPPLSVWIGRDPAAATQWMLTHLPEDERTDAAGHALRLAREQHPAAALQVALTPGIDVDDSELGQVLGEFAASDPAAGRVAFSGLEPTRQSLLARDFVEAWVRTDVTSCLEWAATARMEPFAAMIHDPLLQAIAARDPRAVIAAASRLGASDPSILFALQHDPSVASLELFPQLSPANRRALAQQLVQTKLSTAPERLLATLRAHASPEDFARTAAEGFAEWRRSDRLAAEAWLQEQPDAGLRTTLQSEVRRHELLRDPAALLDYVAGGGAPPDADTMVMALHRFAEHDPGRAARWAQQHGPDLDPQLVSSLATQWLYQDEAAAAAWVLTLPPGDRRDDALTAVAVHWAGEGDHAALTTALAGVQDPARQLAAHFSVYETLLDAGDDAAAAESWLSQQNLSEETKRAWRATRRP